MATGQLAPERVGYQSRSKSDDRPLPERVGNLRRPALELGGNRVAADTAGSGLQGFRPITIGRYRMTLLQLDPYPEPGKDPLAPTSTALIRVEPIRPETSTSGQSR